MKKVIISGIIITILIATFFIISYLRIRFAKIEVTLVENLQIPVRSEKKWSNMITSINGTILNDEPINTLKLGPQEKNIVFKNNDGIKVQYKINVEIVDITAPIVWINNQYTVTKGANENIFNSIMCADNYDPNPYCRVEGDYDLNTVGTYDVTFIAEDQSHNKTQKKFKLNVKEPTKPSTNNGGGSPKTTTKFQDIINTYKNENTEIGLDISHWQGDVDYETLKQEGVEFVFLRVGTSTGIDGENILDKKFIQNIEGATKAGIPVGLYFYSYANNEERAKQDALWVLEQIKDYKIDLPIAFDWENWNSFNDYNLSLFGLTDMAKSFLKIIEDAGYKGILYSSKSYLEQVWYPTEYKTWLAHYTKLTNYQGDYDFWQICSDGKINGIKGAVDINIRYKK